MTTKNFEDLVKTILTEEEIKEIKGQVESEVKRLKNNQTGIRSSMKHTYIFLIEPDISTDKYTLVTPYGTILGGFGRMLDILTFLQEHYKTKEVEFVENRKVVVRSNVKDDNYEQHTVQ